MVPVVVDIAVMVVISVFGLTLVTIVVVVIVPCARLVVLLVSIMLVVVISIVDRVVVLVIEMLTIVFPFLVMHLNIVLSDVILSIVPGIVSVDGSGLICGTIVIEWPIVVPVVVLVMKAIWTIVLCTTFWNVETVLVVLGIVVLSVVLIGWSVRVYVVVGFEE